MSDVLLHACCAPCAAWPLELLAGSVGALFYYNPNITSEKERDLRFAELARHAGSLGVTLLRDDSGADEWMAAVAPLAHLGERSERCAVCFRLRLARTFARARADGFAAVATVLTISPHKDAALINAIGTDLSVEYGIAWQAHDFKADGGFARGAALSKQHAFYRQNYCGCIFSQREAEERRARKHA